MSVLEVVFLVALVGLLVAASANGLVALVALLTVAGVVASSRAGARW